MIEDILENGDYQKGVHDKIVKRVERRLRETGLYDNIIHNSEYSCLMGDGEIDLAAEAEDRVFLFEMKSNDHYKSRKKGLQQLKRSEDLIHEYRPTASVYKFFVYGTGKGHYDLRRVD